MKVILLFILVPISGNVFGQAKELNELIRQYILRQSTEFVLTFTWDKNPPMALQNSRELLVPDPIGEDLSIIKWKDIDSVRLSDIRTGGINVVVFGKVARYVKCKTTGKHNIRYYDTIYCRKNKGYNIRIILASRNDSIKISASNAIRKQVKKAFQQLNNVSVIEDYSPLPPSNALVGYDPVINSIIQYENYDEYKKPVIFAKDLQYAKSFCVAFGCCNISSFDLYFSDGADHLIGQSFNEGTMFNDEILKLLSNIQPGTWLTFDNVKVTDPMGKIRTIQGFGFMAQ